MGTHIRSIVLALGLGVGATVLWPAPARNDAPEEPGDAPGEPVTPEVDDDPRVQAFLEAYAPLIDSVRYEGDDVVFVMGSEPIHFREGRMLGASRLDRETECDPIFYSYPLEPMSRPPAAPGEMPTYCTDLLESLWGNDETEIRRHGRSVRFLDHRMFVNELLVEPLATVERDIRNVAETDPSVSMWVDDVDITYSFSFREIAGSGTRSQHSWGLAVDFVPSSYDGRAAYWRWSRVFDRESWYAIPMAERWSPPQRVISIFERHGFVWGGKWPHFDAIHFEYRPEILLYSRLTQQ